MRSRAVLLATGASYQRLWIPALEALDDATMFYEAPRRRRPAWRAAPGSDCRVSQSVELLGRNSKQNNVTRLHAILAGHERDRLPARATRSRQIQRRLDAQERAQLLAAYNEGVMISDLAEMFGISQSATLANLARLGAEPRRGIVQRRLEKQALSTRRAGHCHGSADTSV